MASAALRVRSTLPSPSEIDGVAALAAGHELRDAERTGIGSFQYERVEVVLTCQQQVVFQLAAEEGARGG